MARKLPTVARILLGLIFTVFGANGFLHFLPNPTVPPAAGAFLGALGASGYMFPLLKLVEVAAGVLLLVGRRVPLALTLLAPIVVNIAAFHLFLAPAGLALPVVVLALELYLAYAYRSTFAPMLLSRVEPSGAEASAGRRTLAAD